MNLEPVPSDRHLRDLLKLYDNTESHIRGLKSLGNESDTYGAILSPVLLAKLLPDLRLIVSRKVFDSKLDVDALLETFELELTTQERVTPQHLQPFKRNQERRTIPMACALFCSPLEPSVNPCCSYCHQMHPSSSCTMVVDVASRKNAIRSNGRCFNCLCKCHISRTCRSSSWCQKCKCKHHISICDIHCDQLQPPSLATTPKTSLHPGASPFQLRQTAINVCSSPSQVIILQTARAVVQNPNVTSISIEVRLRFNGGSQRSYLSVRARDLLRLGTCGEHSLSHATFGSLNHNEKVCPIVKVHLCSKGYRPVPLLCMSYPPVVNL